MYIYIIDILIITYIAIYILPIPMDVYPMNSLSIFLSLSLPLYFTSQVNLSSHS